MSKAKLVSTIIVMAVVFCVSAWGPSFAQDKETRDLNNYTCKDIKRLSRGDRDVEIGVLHAYLLGKKGVTKFNVEKLSEATDQFIEYCLDNPNAKALETMRKFTQ